MKLPTQMWLGDHPVQHLLHEVSNGDHFLKPNGGLWTSSLRDGSSAWWDWCEGENFGDYDSCWLLEPVEARIAVIKGMNDLYSFEETYKRPRPDWMKEEEVSIFRLGYLIDYEKAAEDFDAIWIPNPRNHRFEMDTIWFNAMDVESTIWFRWMFESVKKLDLSSPHRQCNAWTYHVNDAKAVCRLTLGHEGLHKAGYFSSFEWSDKFTRHTRRSAPGGQGPTTEHPVRG